jgi:hypothetical protein
MIRRLIYGPILQTALPLMLNLQWLRFVVNTLGGLGFPGILIDTQWAFGIWIWWKHH